jgi:hypothetical protein
MPYSYESFILATRYFPEFGAGLRTGQPPYTSRDLQRRDLAAFFAHIVAETGENDYKLYKLVKQIFKFINSFQFNYTSQGLR